MRTTIPNGLVNEIEYDIMRLENINIYFIGKFNGNYQAYKYIYIQKNI